jgi:anti-sigma-K factor RskA
MSDDDDILAAEHVLGLADASGRVARDPDFAAAVERWQERLLPMLAEGERAPPSAMWTRIVDALPAPARAEAQATPAAAGRWRIATFVATAAAAAMAGLLLLRPAATTSVAPPAGPPQVAAAPTPHMMVAALTPERGSGMVAVTFDAGAGRMTVMPSRMDAGGKAPELWMIPADGKPRSLGVIPDRKAATMTLAPAERHMLAEGVMLAVSLEPAGGSPTGAPTGPVVMKGKMQLV